MAEHEDSDSPLRRFIGSILGSCLHLTTPNELHAILSSILLDEQYWIALERLPPEAEALGRRMAGEAFWIQQTMKGRPEDPES